MTPYDAKWYYEVKEELLSLKPDLASINPSVTYSGQLLVAADLGKFWVTTRRKGGGYSTSNINSWRWEVMDQCISADSSYQMIAYQTLIDNDVDVIIATQDTIEQLQLFAKYNKLELPVGVNWLLPLRTINH